MDANASPDARRIELCEGLQLKLVDSGAYSPRTLFTVTAWCSAMLGGKPVRCAGFLPGVSLLVHVLQHDVHDVAFLVSTLWSKAQIHIDSWIEIAEQYPCMVVPVDGAGITLALDRVITLEKGVMQVDALRARWRRDEAFAPPI